MTTQPPMELSLIEKAYKEGWEDGRRPEATDNSREYDWSTCDSRDDMLLAEEQRGEIWVNDECRKAFEANTIRLCEHVYDHEMELKKKPNGAYVLPRIQAAWMAWQDCWDYLRTTEPVSVSLGELRNSIEVRSARDVTEVIEVTLKKVGVRYVE